MAAWMDLAEQSLYIYCLNNNKAASVRQIFHDGVAHFGLSSRIHWKHSMKYTGVTW